MPPAGFEPTISADERPQTYALDRAATGNGIHPMYRQVFFLYLGSCDVGISTGALMNSDVNDVSDVSD